MAHTVGPYRLLDSLAKGGAGDVYRATSSKGRTVALKVLRGPFTERRRKRAEVEIRALERLDHPAILPMLDCGWHDGGLAYMAFPLAKGGSLQDRIKHQGQLPVSSALRITRQLGEALSHAHAVGVLHRDLKPDNVLLTDGEIPRLIDFGLAREIEATYTRVTTSGTFLGTPGYWAPEQAEGRLEELGPWTDVYGLGATLYACLTSEPPFVASTVGELLGMILQRARPVPPLTRRPELDPQLSALCMRCLAFDPAERPSMAELTEALSAFERMPNPSSPSPSGPSARTLGIAAAAAAAAALSLALAIAVRNRAPQQSAAQPSPAAHESPAPGDPPLTRPFPAPDSQEAGQLAVDLCLLSNEALSGGSFDLAFAYADAATRVRPDYGYGYFRRANVYSAWGRTQRALDDYERSLELGIPQPSDAIYNLGVCLQARNDLARARECYATAAAQRPRWANPLIKLAGLDMASGDWKAGAAAYSHALEVDPDNVFALCNRGTAQLKLGRLREAKVDLERCVELAPRLQVAWENLGLARQGLRDMRGALAAFRRGLAIKTTPALYGRTAAVFHAMGQLTECVAELDKALELDPRMFNAWLNKGDLSLQLRRDREAERAYARAVELAPGDPRAWAGQGRVRARRGDDRGAIEAYDRALTLDPRNLAALQNRGSANARLGNYAAAIFNYTRALELEPSTWQALLNRGRAHKANGSPELARADWQRVVKSAPPAFASQARGALAELE